MLRPYQEADLEQIREAYRHGFRRPLLVQPTGSGKGFLIAYIVETASARGHRIQFWVNRRTLVYDMSQRLERLGIDHGILMAGSKRRKPWLPVQVASVDTLRNRDALPPADLICLDEAHFAVSEGWQQMIARYPDAKFLLATATPIRLDGRGLGEIADIMITGPSVQSLIGQGYLVPSEVYSFDSADLSGVEKRAGDFNQKQLAQAVDNNTLVGDAVKEWQRLASDRKSVAFCVDKKHAAHVRDQYRAAGVEAIDVNDETPDDERDKIWRDFDTGSLKMVTSVGVISYGWDHPICSCVQLLRPTQSLQLHLQQIGRGCRPWAGKTNCIAEGQLVLTDAGLVPIEQVSNKMKLWDGEEFVCHGGSIYKGEQDVITWAGLTATADHQVWTEKGWKAFGDCAIKQIPLAQTGSGGQAIRKSRGYFSGNGVAREARKSEDVCLRSMFDLRTCLMDFFRQSFTRTYGWLQAMWTVPQGSSLAIATGFRSEGSLQESKSRSVALLRWAWNSLQFLLDPRGVHLDTRQSWATEGEADRSHQQRRELRGWQFALVNTGAELGAHQENPSQRLDTRVQNRTSRDPVCRCYSSKVFRERYVTDRNLSAMGGTVVQAKRRVWDVLDSGPFHRFTVSGVLVHNCLVLDHAGNHGRHGFYEQHREWSLQGGLIKKPHDKVTPVAICRACYFTFPSGPDRCPACGAVIPKQHRNIQTIEGELQKLERKAEAIENWRSHATQEQKMRRYLQLRREARERGYKMGYAFMRYKAEFHEPPDWSWNSVAI